MTQHNGKSARINRVRIILVSYARTHSHTNYTNTEIKSLRAGKASLADAFCYFVDGELYVKGMNISTYFWASKWGSHEPARDRKLLLTKKELRHLAQAVKTKGLTIVAVRAYIAENGYAKLHIALAKGKKEFDKRATIKEKDIRREMERE